MLIRTVFTMPLVVIFLDDATVTKMLRLRRTTIRPVVVAHWSVTPDPESKQTTLPQSDPERALHISMF